MHNTESCEKSSQSFAAKCHYFQNTLNLCFYVIIMMIIIKFAAY